MNSLKTVLSFMAMTFGIGSIYQGLSDSMFAFESIYLYAMTLASEEMALGAVE